MDQNLSPQTDQLKPERAAKSITIISILILVVGSGLRLYHLGIVGVAKPWALGGLYLAFARQIHQSHYALPVTIPFYSLGGLPFAYPPLPFYVEAFLVFTLGLPRFLVTNALPPLISVISLLAFHRLTKKILRHPAIQLFALAIFALLPLSFADQVEGAGLAESFGTLFIILLIGSYWALSQALTDKKRLVLTALLWALNIMASPASAYLSVFIFLGFAVQLLIKKQYRVPKILSSLALLGIAAAILSAPYWGAVLKNHGLALFIDSFLGQHGGYRNFLVDALLKLAEFTNAPTALLFPALFTFTLGVLIYFREYGFVLLLVLASLIPREFWVVGILGVIFLGYAVDLLISKRETKPIPERKKWLAYAIALPLMVALIGLDLAHFLTNRDLLSPENVLSDAQVALLEDIESINPDGAALIVIGEDPFLEWAPYLAQTTVLNEWYGTEFAPEKSGLEALNRELKSCADLPCVSQLIRENFAGEVLVLIDTQASEHPEWADEAQVDLQEYEDSGIVYYQLD